MKNLELAKIRYPKGTTFFSATGKVSAKLTVNFLLEATHIDRQERLNYLKSRMLKKWNELFYDDAKDHFKQLAFDNEEFLKEVKFWKEEFDYLRKLPRDIINESGGVIYCGETNKWAK